MKNKICLTLTIVFILSVIPTYAETPTLLYKTDYLTSNTDFVLKKVIECESGGNINAIGKCGEVGILQFMPSTWELWTKKMNRNLDIYNPEHQIEVYRYAAKNGLLRSWTCFTKLFP